MWPPAPMPLELGCCGRRRPAVDGVGRATPILTTGYIDVALEREVDGDTLNRAPYALARFVRDRLSATVYVEQLTASVLRIGLPETEIRTTLASALLGRT